MSVLKYILSSFLTILPLAALSLVIGLAIYMAIYDFQNNKIFFGSCFSVAAIYGLVTIIKFAWDL